LQDQGFARQNQYLHQDSGAWRRAGIRGDWTQRGRYQGQERDIVGGRTLFTDQSFAQKYGRNLVPAWTSERPWTRYHPGMWWS